jgi:hypothetical protein
LGLAIEGLKLKKDDELLSNFALNFNLRLYTKAKPPKTKQAGRTKYPSPRDSTHVNSRFFNQNAFYV